MSPNDGSIECKLVSTVTAMAAADDPVQVTPQSQLSVGNSKLDDFNGRADNGNGNELKESTSGTTGSGRSRRKRFSNNEDFYVSDFKPKPSRKKKKVDKDPEDEFESSWICCECKEAECMMKADADQLVICEGPCRRLSHYPCAGLNELPPEDEKYICNDCKNERHQCSFCQLYGDDDKEVFRCKKENCGLFFHEHCLAVRNVKVEHEATQAFEGEGDDSDDEISKPVFVCPTHSCWTCTQTYDLEQEEKSAKEQSTKKKGKRPKKGKPKGVYSCKSGGHMVRCMICPFAFHITCIPPTAGFHELALLCHEHTPTHKLPDLDPTTSIQGTIEEQMNNKWSDASADKLRKRRTGNTNPFLPGLSGDALTSKETKLIGEMRKFENREEIEFCLPCDMKDEVHSQPPSYHHVQSLIYDPKHKPTKIEHGDYICECVGFCGDDCLNRMLYTECFGDGGKKGKSNCRVGKKCGNRAISRRQFASCKPVREQGKGWGLRSKDTLMKGDLILEYIGDVIDDKEKEARLLEWEKDHPNDPNFYVMSLRDQWYIDARKNANLSRFINHSCDPNCILTQIVVNGYIRNGIFAKREIAAGEILSYDYQFDTNQGDRFVCRCGAKNCRGTMKGGSASLLSPVKKTKSEKWDEAKAKFERDKKFIEDYYEQEQTRGSQVKATVPAAENKDETVSNGIQHRFRGEVMQSRLFLWRNGVRGSDLARRLEAYTNSKGKT